MTKTPLMALAAALVFGGAALAGPLAEHSAAHDFRLERDLIGRAMDGGRFMKTIATMALALTFSVAALMVLPALTGSAVAGEYGALFDAFGVPMKGVVLQAEKAIEAGDYQRAHDLLQPEANAGNADAQTLLGLMYASDLGVEASNTLTRTLMMQALLCAAAGKGHPLAMSFAESAECE